MKVKSPTALLLAIALTLVAALPAAAMTAIGERGSAAVSFLAPLDVPPADEPPSGTVRLMSGGDVVLADSVGRRILKRGPLAPWQGVKQYFDQADLVVVNLECTISERGTAWNKTYTFRAPPAAVDSLVAGGVDVVTLANNHALDYGRLAFGDELALLDAQRVGHVGGGANVDAARAPLIVERNGLRIALLGYVLPFSGRPHFNTRQWAATATLSGLAIGTPDVVTQDVKAAKQAADVVVVIVHGGIELSSRPNKKQRRFDAAAIAAGASLVIGHHPHVLQGYVYVDKTVIAYSLGNFVFYMAGGSAVHDTAILDVTLSAQGVESLAWIPIEIHKGFPRAATAAERARISARLKRLPPP